MITTIKTAIKSLLDTLEGIEVYDYPESKVDSYPSAFVTWEGNESIELTNTQDSVYLIFRVVLVQEKMEELKGKKNAETTSEDRAWKIETLFRENNDLGLANVLRVLPVNTIKRYDDTRIILEVELRVHILADVKT